MYLPACAAETFYTAPCIAALYSPPIQISQTALDQFLSGNVSALCLGILYLYSSLNLYAILNVCFVWQSPELLGKVLNFAKCSAKSKIARMNENIAIGNVLSDATERIMRVANAHNANVTIGLCT